MKTILKSVILVSTILFFSCGGDDDTVEVMTPELAPLLLECPGSVGVAAGETLILENRNSGIDYIIDCVFTVKGDFTIQDGVTIQFNTDAGIRVDDTGSLQILGQQANPVVLTGEDSSPGAWRGVFFYSNDIKNKIEHAKIDYAGGIGFNSNDDRGSVIVYADGRLNMNNTTITQSETYGFNASYGGSELVLTDNTIKMCSAPMYIEGAYPTTISGGDYTGNTLDAIIVTNDQISGNHNWTKLNVPYHLINGLQVIPGGKLTIEPGVIVEFGLDAQLYINEGASGPKPSLIAVGTAQEPITFTGINKTQGAWQGIRFDTPSVLNEIGFATIEYASNPNLSGAVYMWYDTVLNVHDVTFKDIQNCAFTTETNPNLSTANITYTNVTNQFCEL